MGKIGIFISAILSAFLANFAVADNVKVSDFGAKADGNFVNTKQIQDAIDKCSATGGGEVLFDKLGTYRTQSIFLKDNVMLNLPRGVVLKGHKSKEYNVALIRGENASNIGITGLGTIDGSGGEFEIGDEAPNRPRLILLKKCKNVLVEGVRLTRPAYWTFYLLQCNNVKINKLNIYAHANYNNDGIDIESKNVVISDCVIDTFDDAIVLKTLNADSTVENVTITNCLISSCASSVKTGTETLGNFKNITISNCIIKKCAERSIVYESRKHWPKTFGVSEGINGGCGINISSVDGAVIENVTISNLVVMDMHVPLCIRVGHRNRGVKGDPKSEIRNVKISGIVAKAESWISNSITATPGHILENIYISDFMLEAKGGAPLEKLQKEQSRVVKDPEKGFPGPRVFGCILPSSAFYVRNANNVTFNNVCIGYWNGGDIRSPFVADNVSNLRIMNSTYKNAGFKEFVTLKDCKDSVFFNNSLLK